MTVSLEGLPFDVLYHIACSLGLDDVVNLSHTCRQVRVLLCANILCRKVVEAHAPYSREGQLARNSTITYGDALQSIYDRREALSNAHPFAARVVGQGSDFQFSDGILCILRGSVIHVQNTRTWDKFEVDLRRFAQQNPPQVDAEPKHSLLSFCENIIVLHSKVSQQEGGSTLLAIRTDLKLADEDRLIKITNLESDHKLFIRHTSSFLYYGTYNRHYDEWEIRGESLQTETGSTLCPRPLRLLDFFGFDIGSTICFEIHDGYFYAISNQTSFEVEEIDWTSFYHCIRFPLHQPTTTAMQVVKLYRRQNVEGPLNDSWTDMSIQIDEVTNEPVIVESRREWKSSPSRQLRSFYFTKIVFPPAGFSEDEEGREVVTARFPQDDPLTALIDATNKPNFAPEQPRSISQVHPEFKSDREPIERSFILSRTKFRAYMYSCKTFLDLVEDDRCCATSPGYCLRIRTGSRRPASLDHDAPYRHSDIKLWPPPASRYPCSQRLHQILNPSGTIGPGGSRTITGKMDERTLVYMVTPGRAYDAEEDPLGTVVFVDFGRDHDNDGCSSSGLSCSGFQPCSEVDESSSTGSTPTEWRWMPGQASRCRNGIC
ncbi:hypothetical protein M011DRAFT_404947 [Sporormia fimetaria CBS 119925]|uniref:F-box domain-containing protein n=1 Tax=Sporormia fimetaria CBS 119925 TaxID=1340428 RepID=A0A6A6V6G9_9PLEO|nr:hypothetical protein M011DRAFT_404947 [Sporormia fimetaria CBS 119925]